MFGTLVFLIVIRMVVAVALAFAVVPVPIMTPTVSIMRKTLATEAMQQNFA